MLTTRQVAERAGVSMRTVRGWRKPPFIGPPYHDLGGSYRYRESEFKAWLESRRRGGK